MTTFGGVASQCSSVAGQCVDQAQGAAIAATDDGGVVVGGAFMGSVTLGSRTFTSQICQFSCPGGFYGSDLLIARLDKEGEVVWAQQFASNNNDWIYDLILGPDGSVYFTGTFAPPITIGATIVSTGAIDTFVAKLDSAGNPLWAVPGGTAVQDLPAALALIGDQLYVGGVLGAGVGHFGAVTLTGAGGTDGYLIELDASSGSATRGWTLGGAGNDAVRGLASDGSHLYLAGTYVGSASLLGTSVVSQGGKDLFVGELDLAAGTLDWSVSGGGLEDDDLTALALRSGRVLAAGAFRGRATIAGVTVQSAGARDGLLIDLDRVQSTTRVLGFGGVGDDVAAAVAIDDRNDAYVSGGFSDVVDFGRVVLTSAGSSDAFVARLPHHAQCGATAFDWAVRAGGPLDDTAKALVARGKGRVFVAGRTRGAADFNGTAHSALGYSDGFFWGLRGGK